MATKFLFAAFHFIALGIGFYGIWSRAEALRRLKDESSLNEVFRADNFWGIAAILWIVTGLWRAFGGLEKGTEFYLACNIFLAKLGLFILVFILEIKPMITLIKWRMARGRGESIDLSPAKPMKAISYIELASLFIIIFLAVGIARGLGC